MPSERQYDYAPSPVPPELSENLLDWLRREFRNVQNGMRFRAVDLSVSHAPPSRLKEGMLRYADGEDWDPGGGKGVYVYDGLDWVKL